MRQGEVCGLRWPDVDFENRRLYIRGALQRVQGKLRIVPTNTRESERGIQLPDVIFAVLAQHQAQQAEEKRLAGSNWRDSGMVFTTEKGTPLDPNAVGRKYRAIVRASALPYIRFHDLRHSASMILHEAGVPTQAMGKLLGHASARTTEETISTRRATPRGS